MNMHSIDAKQLPLRQRFFVAGASCLVSTNSPAVINALSQWTSRHDGVSTRSFDLSVCVDPAAKSTRDACPHFRGREHLVFASFGESDLFVFDLCRRSVAGYVSEATAQDGRFWTNLLLPIAIGLLGTTIGVVPVHAACLDWKGRGLMIAGVSGTGKSTLAVALSQYGFSLVSDDWTYVVREDRSVNAYGISAPVKLLPDARHFFPELHQFQPAKSLNGEMAFEVDASRTFGSAVRLESEPTWLVMLQRTERTGCDFTPLSGEKIRLFFERSVERLPEPIAHVAGLRSETIAELANRHCWLLRYGGPPRVAAEALRQLCQGM